MEKYQREISFYTLSLFHSLGGSADEYDSDWGSRKAKEPLSIISNSYTRVLSTCYRSCQFISLADWYRRMSNGYTYECAILYTIYNIIQRYRNWKLVYFFLFHRIPSAHFVCGVFCSVLSAIDSHEWRHLPSVDVLPSFYLSIIRSTRARDYCKPTWSQIRASRSRTPRSLTIAD